MQRNQCLGQKDLARRWNISHRTLERWRYTGHGPAFLKLGGRVLYRQTDVEAFEQSHLSRALAVSNAVDNASEGPCCTNQLRDSFYESSVVAGGYERLVPYEVQDQELAFVQHGAKAARFAINLV